MDEPNPRPEELYKRPEELFHHPKPAPNYGESPSLPNKKRFQSNLGKHRGKKPLQVGADEIDLMANKHFITIFWQCFYHGEDIDKDGHRIIAIYG